MFELERQTQQWFDQKNYDAVIELYKKNQSTEFSDELLKLVAISYYRKNLPNNCLNVLHKISKNFLKEDYLLNEILAHCYLKNGNFDAAYDALSAALNLRPNLIQARHRLLVLSARKGLVITKQEIDHCWNNAIKIGDKNWIRELAYIYYSKGYYTETNRCIDKIVEFGGQLDLLDRLAYTAAGQSTRHYEPKQYFKERFVQSTQNSDHLVVILSPDHNFAFKAYQFSTSLDLLYIADETYSWYCFLVNELSEFLIEKISKFGYKKVTLLGGSKAASGALVLYQYLIKKIKIPVNCIAFSPQIDLYPYNNNLIIPTYLTLSTYFAVHPAAYFMMNKVLQPKHIQVRAGDSVKIFYGKGFEMDKVEAQKIPQSSGVEVIGLDFSGHSTSIPYTIPEGRTYEQLKTFYAKLSDLDDQDFQALGGGQTVNLIDEIWALYQDPEVDLNKLIEKS